MRNSQTWTTSEAFTQWTSSTGYADDVHYAQNKDGSYSLLWHEKITPQYKVLAGDTWSAIAQKLYTFIPSSNQQVTQAAWDELGKKTRIYQ